MNITTASSQFSYGQVKLHLISNPMKNFLNLLMFNLRNRSVLDFAVESLRKEAHFAIMTK
jgi:hypothetical protein